MEYDDVYIEDDFVEDDEVRDEEETTSEPQEKTLEDLLPTDCIVLSMEGGNIEPLVSVRGKFSDLGEAQAFLRYALARVQYFKHVQERS